MKSQLKKLAILNTLGRTWIVALVLLTPSLCYAQQSRPSSLTSQPSSVSSADDPVLKALNEMTVRAIAAESKVEVYEARLKDKDLIIEAWQGRALNDEKQLAVAGKIDSNSQGVQTIDNDRIIACQQQLAKADARIFTLEHPGLLKELFEPKQFVKMGAAFWLGRATANK